MNRNSLYSYFIAFFAFVFLTETVMPAFNRPALYFGIIIFEFVMNALLNPLSWAVYYVHFRKRAWFRRSTLLLGYEIIIGFISSLFGLSSQALLFPYGGAFTNPAEIFIVLNLANPVSWIIIYLSVGKRRGRSNDPLENYYLSTGEGNSQVHGTVGSPDSESTGKSLFRDISGNEAAGRSTVKSQAARFDEHGEAVTLVGFAGDGKTTFTAMFLHASSYIDSIPGFDLLVENASPVVRDGMQRLLDGEWPSLTLRSEYRTQTSLTLIKESKVKSRRVNLTINDLSGEFWREVSSEGTDSVDKVQRLARENPSALAMIRARKYIVTINCEDFRKWDTGQLDFMDLFKAIRSLSGEKVVRKPTAIVFTKLDYLDDEVQDMPGERILQNYMPFLYSYIKEHFNRNTFGFFKVGIRMNDLGKPQVYNEDNRRRLAILGGGKIGEFPDIVRWMLD